jgi:hypothetical protein
MKNDSNGRWYSDVLGAELLREARTTRRVLERVPEEHLSWRHGAR